MPLKKFSSLNEISKISLLAAMLLLLNSLKADYLDVNNSNIKKFKSTNPQTLEYEETGDSLNFSDGFWVHIENNKKDLKILEFHSAKSGILIFSKTDNSQMLYLNAPERVLVFQLRRKPYVEKSLLNLFGGIENVKKWNKDGDSFVHENGIKITIIYDSTKDDPSTFRKKMEDNREKILTEKYWKSNVKLWKEMPFFAFQKGSELVSEYENTWGAFLLRNDDFKNFANNSYILKPDPLSFYELDRENGMNYRLTKQRIVANLMRKVILGDDSNSLWPRLTIETMCIQEFLLSEAGVFMRFFQRDGDHSVHQSLESLMTNFNLLATIILTKYFFEDGFAFFRDYFLDYKPGIIKYHLTKQRQEMLLRYPPLKRALISARTAMKEGDLLEENQGNYTGMFSDEINQITADFKNIIEVGFDKLIEKLKWVNKENSLYMLVDFLKMKFTDDESDEVKQFILDKKRIVTQYKEEDHDKIKQGLLNMNFADATYEILIMEILPRYIAMYEERIMGSINRFEPINKMYLPLSSGDDLQNAFDKFRMGLAMIGKVDFRNTDKDNLSSDNYDIFSWRFGNFKLI